MLFIVFLAVRLIILFEVGLVEVLVVVPEVVVFVLFIEDLVALDEEVKFLAAPLPKLYAFESRLNFLIGEGLPELTRFAHLKDKYNQSVLPYGHVQGDSIVLVDWRDCCIKGHRLQPLVFEGHAQVLAIKNESERALLF